MRLESLPLLRDGDERGLRSRDEDGVATAPDELLETVHERRGVGERVGQKVALATAPGPEPCAEPGAGHGSDSVAGPLETSARTEYRTLLRIGDENALHHVRSAHHGASLGSPLSLPYLLLGWAEPCPCSGWRHSPSVVRSSPRLPQLLRQDGSRKQSPRRRGDRPAHRPPPPERARAGQRSTSRRRVPTPMPERSTVRGERPVGLTAQFARVTRCSSTPAIRGPSTSRPRAPARRTPPSCSARTAAAARTCRTGSGSRASARSPSRISTSRERSRQLREEPPDLGRRTSGSATSSSTTSRSASTLRTPPTEDGWSGATRSRGPATRA